MNIPNLTREDQMLVCIARRMLDDANAAKVRGLLGQGPLDWEYISTTAATHGISSLLAHHLQSFSDENLPSSVRLELKSDNQKQTEHCLFLAGELAKVIRALQQKDVPAIPFKGPTLALTAYGDPGLRQFADLDVLVKRRDVKRAKEILGAQGFRLWRTLNGDQEAALFRFENACSFHKQPDVFVDVHWQFAPARYGFAIERANIWQRLTPLKIGSQTVFTLSNEDLLLVLCGHGFTHQWERLGWICDVATLLERQSDFDWDYISNTAKQIGVLRILLLGLFLATQLSQVCLPTEVRERLDREAEVRRIGTELSAQLFEKDKKPVGLSKWLRLELRMRERNRDRIKTLLAAVLTPRDYDWMFVSVPPSVWPLYYLIRPLRWAAQRRKPLADGQAD